MVRVFFYVDGFQQIRKALCTKRLWCKCGKAILIQPHNHKYALSCPDPIVFLPNPSIFTQNGNRNTRFVLSKSVFIHSITCVKNQQIRLQ